MRVVMEAIVMEGFDHEEGSRSRAGSPVYPGEFLPDADGSQHGAGLDSGKLEG